MYPVRAQHLGGEAAATGGEVRPKEKKNIVNFPDSFQRDQYSVETPESDASWN